MSLTTSPPAFDARASLHFPVDLRLTSEQFELVCAENREAVLELDADGRLIAMTPTGSETGSRNGELLFQLKLFASRAGGWKAFDSSTGFRLPDGSVFSPDERCGFAPPRGLTALRSKMTAYQINGARLGWLLIPQEQAVEVFPAFGIPQRLELLEVLEATPDFPGLQLQLAEIWAG